MSAVIVEIDEVPIGTPPPVTIDGVVDVLVQSPLPLPTGAATSANQVTQQASLSSIDARQAPPATAVQHYVVTMTNANQEYSRVLPANTKILTWRPRSAVDVRYAFVAGVVGTSSPPGPFFTLKAGEVFNERNINLAAGTLYIASVAAGTIVEIEAWS